MNKPDIPRPPSAPKGTTNGCCTEEGCELGLRNNYFEGKRLTPDTFRVEQRYAIERRRLLNRAIHGWGVVYGFALKASPAGEARFSRLRVDSGLALDACGRELLQVDAAALDLESVIVLDESGQRSTLEAVFSKRKKGSDYTKICWQLSAHYAERVTDSVYVRDPCQCERREWDHTCETVRYTLRPIACSACCAGQPCELECGCCAGDCCREAGEGRKKSGSEQLAISHQQREGRASHCICSHLTDLALPDDCSGMLCDIEEACGHVRVDLTRGVPLACIRVSQDDCSHWVFSGPLEACGARRFVKRNDLLFDLIRGCDLTRIAEIGWTAWHRAEDAIDFDDFSEAMGSVDHDKDRYTTKDFWVKFSRPVRRDTLRPDCFAITVMSVEREGGWWQTFRVPIVDVKVDEWPGDSADTTRGARLVVDGSWAEDGLCGRRSLFRGDEVRIELEVRGDFIIDCNGQAVDANAVGRIAAPTGNGTPGGTFLSTFRVAARGDADRKAQSQGASS